MRVFLLPQLVALSVRLSPKTRKTGFQLQIKARQQGRALCVASTKRRERVKKKRGEVARRGRLVARVGVRGRGRSGQVLGLVGEDGGEWGVPIGQTALNYLPIQLYLILIGLTINDLPPIRHHLPQFERA